MTNKTNDVRVVSVELLEEIVSNLSFCGARHKLTEILAQPADQQGEPDFYEVSGNGVRHGLFYTHPDWAMEDPRYTVTPHWRSSAQPARAKVALPERKKVDPYCYDQGGNANVQGWNACLDEVAKLNTPQ